MFMSKKEDINVKELDKELNGTVAESESLTNGLEVGEEDIDVLNVLEAAEPEEAANVDEKSSNAEGDIELMADAGFDELEIERDAATKIAEAVGVNQKKENLNDSMEIEDILDETENSEALDQNTQETEEDESEQPKKKAGKSKKSSSSKAFRTERDAFEDREKRRLEAEQRKNEAYEENLKWQLIQSHRLKNSILKGSLISVEDTSSKDGLVAVVEYAGYRVLIPFREMFAKEPIANVGSLTKEEVIRRHRLLLLKLLGAEVEFVIAAAQTVTDPTTKQKTKIVVGSRKLALNRTRRYYFGKNSAGERRINVGDKIKQVPIIAVGRESIRVVIGGVETSIKKNSLSYKYISNVAAEFKVGMKIDVLITDITENDPEDPSDVSIKANHKITYLPYFKENVKNCKPGGYYKAQITHVQSFQFYLFLTDINAPAFCRVARFWDVSDLPKPGDEVIFMANMIDDNLGVVHGVITRTL